MDVGRKVLVALVIVLASCRLSAAPGASPSASPAPGAPKPVVVRFDGPFPPTYRPFALSIPVGTTVSFIGDFKRYPFVADGDWCKEKPDGKTMKVTFTTPGTFNYHCAERAATMNGTIVVKSPKDPEPEFN
jgi:plastocyanin